ncbi:hypothetical protein SAMN02990966_05542 [Rhodospirillales bacterium URHD0017]|nr:hypothetical protein SAMN02990966_05542 [Rhodospirillales bacterium URHD0017]
MKNPFATTKKPLTFQEELQQKQKQIMAGVYFKSATDRYIKSDPRKDIQQRVVEQVKEIAKKFPDAVVIQPPGDKSGSAPLKRSQRTTVATGMRSRTFRAARW